MKGILLVNLGTPDSPATGDVRRYLLEFLMDERVIDIPLIQRNLLVKGIIAPFRAPKSAKTYRRVWTREGSPLLVISLALRDQLDQKLNTQLNSRTEENYQVEIAMRYGKPSIASVLGNFKGKKLDSLRIVALYPQYASASTGSVHVEVMRLLKSWEVIPPLQFVTSFHNQPTMIKAFCELAEGHDLQKFDHVLFSFHGLPEGQLIKADSHNHCLKTENCCKTLSDTNYYCYSAQSYDTARLIAEGLGIQEVASTNETTGVHLPGYSVSFQSRLGKAEWKKPYTSQVIKELGAQGKKRVLVFCPAFVSDCLETLYEVRIELQEEFKASGGEELVLVDGLNTHPRWIEALAEICTLAI